MKRRNLLVATLFAATLGISMIASAEETTMEKVETATNKGTDKIKKGYRKGKEKGCEMMNGKMECAGQKMKHGVENGMDTMGTKVEEVKKKTD